jgi:PAS domain S-box-containing protein
VYRPGAVEEGALTLLLARNQLGRWSRLGLRAKRFCGAARACKNPPMLMGSDPGKASRSAGVLLLGCAALAALTAITFALHTRLMVVALLYIAVIALASMTGEVVAGVTLALLAAACLNYFFILPIFSFAIDTPQDLVALIVFVVTALLVTNLVNRARRFTEAATLQEARLREAQRIAHVGWWERDFRTSHVSLSDEVCRIFGVEPLDLPDWHERWLALIHPDDRPKAAEAAAAALRGGPRYDVEYRVIRPDDTVRVVHSQGDVTRDEAGRPLRQFGVLQDITELRRTEYELRASEARFRTFVEYAGDAFFLLDEQSSVVDVNRRACDSLGYTREELIGMTPADFDVGLDEASIQRVRQRLVAGETLTFETRHRRKDGTVFPVEIRSAPFEQDGRRFLSLVRDISERKHAEQRVLAEHAVTRILAEAATVEEAMPKVLQALCECLRWDLSALWLVDRDAEVLRCAELWCAPSVEAPEFEAATWASTFGHGSGLPGRVWASRAPACIPDVAADPSFLRGDVAAREGLHAAFAIPILLGAEVLGVIDLVSREVREPDQGLLDMVATIGSQIGQFIERKRAEKALLKSEERFRTLVDFSFDVYWETDSEHRFVRQEFVEGLADAPPSSELGQTRWEVPYVEPDEAAWRKHRETLDAHLPFRDFELARPMPDGGTRYVSVSGLPVFDDAGRFVGYRGVGRHITERKRAEASLRTMQSQLAHANRVATVGQLTASISHEVAQPVAASITNANAALRWLGAKPPDLDEVHAALDRILRNGKRASEVIGRIRALVRREAPRYDRFDLNEMIREIIVLTQAELSRTGISLQTRLTEGLPLVTGDRVQLQQVILNLILNAVEAMSGSADQTSDLLITTDQDGADGLHISVCDSGPGLPPDAMARLFEAFYTTKPSGMGMGLSICRTIVEAHGGRIWAAPNEPRGAVFQFTLPREPAENVSQRQLASLPPG